MCPHLSSFATHKPGSETELAKAFHDYVTSNAPDWFVDSRATDHMASSTSSVTHVTPYDAQSKVMFGDSNTLPISHIGKTTINKNIQLQEDRAIKRLLARARCE